VNTRGRKVIEMTDAELVASYKTGKLTARSLVWSEGMRQWAPLGDVSRVSALLRADSQPPESYTRAVADETEPAAGTKTYRSAGSEPPTNPGTSPGTNPGTNPGTLAIYERPLATIVFPDGDEAPESSDEPTPAFGMSADDAAPPTIKRVAPQEPHAGRTTLVDGVFEPAPALPPMPPRPQAFPAPVLASPLGAALSSAGGGGDGYALAKATPLTLKSTPAAPRLVTPLPAQAAPAPAAAAPTPSSAFVPPPPPLPAAAKTVTFSPPRPAIEFLPPIIVQEKEDDGASLIELPPEAQLELDQLRAQAEGHEAHVQAAEVPLDVGFHESTLILAGRRPKRWIPLGAAVAISVGAACLAAAFTAVIVRTRPAPPARVVETRVLVPAPTPTVETPAAVTQPAAAAPQTTLATAAPRPEKTAERSASRSEPSASKADVSASTKPSWKREDPGELDESSAPAAAPPRQQRAGFPTSPGF
jgi:hypothetical protein